MNKTGKRIVCWILSAMMLAGQGQAVFAEEETEITEQPEETEVVSVDTEFIEEQETVTEEPEEEITEVTPEPVQEPVPEETVAEEVTEPVYEAEADYTYTVSGGNAIITKYTGSESSVVIPDTLGGSTVTEIKSSAFSGKTGITSVRFPSTLTTIGSSAFNGCTSLSSVVFPDSVTKIGASAFNKCPLENLVLPKYLAGADSGAFANNSRLSSIFIPKTLNSTSSLFSGCSNLKNISFEEGMTYVPQNLFSNQSSLEEIVIPEDIIEIRASAFNGCKNLKEVSLPSTLTTIGSSAFNACTSLTHIDFPDSVTKIGPSAFNNDPLEDLVLPKYLANADSGAFANNPKLTLVMIPKTLNSTSSLFSGCSNLKNISFEEGMTYVPQNLFSNQSSLEEIVIPEGMIEIRAGAFNGCSNLKEVSLPSTLTTIASSAFNACTSLTHIEFPDSVTKLGPSVFNQCPLENLVLPKYLANADSGAFANNPKLTSVMIPKTLNSTSSLFSGCSNLKNISFEEGMTYVPQNLFSTQSSLEEIVIPEGIIEIRAGAFNGCKNLKEVSLPSTLTTIGSSGFNGCTSLTHIDFPDSVTKIGPSAFNNDPLEDLVLPKYLANADSGAFANNPKLTSVMIPKTMYSQSSLFSGCSNLKNISFEEGMTYVPQNLFSTQSSLEEIVIPEGIIEIRAGAFNGCQNLKEVSLPSTLTTIGSSAFNNCLILSHIDFPDSVKNIGPNAFNKVPLNNLVLPKYLAKAESGAFANNPVLTSVMIPKTMYSQSSLFSGCIHLKDVVFEEGTTAVQMNLFSNQTSLERIVIPEGITEIRNSAFSGCTNLKYVSIADSVRTIAADAFKNCSQMMIRTNYDTYGVIYAIDNSKKYESINSHPADSVMLDRRVSQYYSDPAGFMINGALPCTVVIEPKEEIGTMTNQSITVYVPKDAEIDLASCTFNGMNVQTSFDEKTRRMVFTTNSSSGVLRFNMQFNSTESMDTYAYFSARLNGKNTWDVIGSFNDVFTGVSISAPDKTSDKTFEVKGLAPAGSQVEVMVDNEVQATATALKTGTWKAEVTLNDPQDHYPYVLGAHVKGSDNEEDSAEKTVIYSAGVPKLQSFVFNDRKGSGVTKSYDLLEDNKMRIFLPSEPYQFVVGFDNADTIDHVYINSIKGTDVKKIEAYFDQNTGQFVTDGWFNDQRSYVPGKLTVTYTEKRDAFMSGEMISDILHHDFNELDGLDIKYEVEHDGVTTEIDLGKLGNDFTNSTLKLTVKYLDKESGADIGQWMGIGKDVVDLSEIIIPGLNKENFILTRNESKEDPNVLTWVVTTGKFAGPLLNLVEDGMKIRMDLITDDYSVDYFKLSDKLTEYSSIKGTLTTFFDVAKIYMDTEKMRDEIMWGPGTTEAKKKAIQDLEELHSDRVAFTILSALGTAALAAAGASPPVLIFSGLLAMMKLASDVCYEYRKDEILAASADVKIKTDPSGYVYDIDTEERIEDVKATAYWIEYDPENEQGMSDVEFLKPENKPADNVYGVVWDAEEYEQINPQMTDENGRYQWDVPTGWWRVKYEKKDYVTTWSEWLPVPPPQLEVNIGLEPVFRHVRNIAFEEDQVTLQPGMDKQLKIIFTPKDPVNTKLSWKSSDETVVKTDDRGKITALKEGMAVITAVSDDGGHTAECTVTVTEDAYTVEGVTRISGKGRWETSLGIAEELKKVYGVEKFHTIILASGLDYPDALAGGYLAYKNNAPILIVSNKNEHSQKLAVNYIRENLAEHGKIYILGGVSAVSQEIADKLEGYNVERLGGSGRYETNMIILQKAGVDDEDILISTGSGYADSLSASAVGRPILLVSPKKGLSDAQRIFLESKKGNRIYILGGEGAVSKEVEAELKSFGNEVKRLEGAGRYQTSVAIAEEFFNDAESAVLAWGGNFPDGLCGGPLAAATGSPLILTKDNEKSGAAKTFAKARNIRAGYMLGGTSALADETAEDIFGEKPVAKEYE